MVVKRKNRMNIVLVFIGGGLGAVARYLVSGWLYNVRGSHFPYGTLIENIVGCFLIGLLMAGFEERFLVSPSLRIFLTIGILGGFTTFSTFSYETISMLQDGELYYASLNVIISVVTCLGGTYLGSLVGKLI